LIGAEFNRVDAEYAAPFGLIAQAIFERLLRLLLAQVRVDRFGIAGRPRRTRKGALS
jgi:hypothetical protein